MPCRTNATTSGIMTGTITIDMSNYFNANRPALGSAIPGPSKVLAGFSSRFTCSINHVGNFPNQSADTLAPKGVPSVINGDAINAELKALSPGTEAAVFAKQCFDLTAATPIQELFYLTASTSGYGIPYSWDGTGTYTASYSIGYQGIALWRESAITTGQYRSHMTKNDVSFTDKWRFNRNAIITMQIGGASLSIRGDQMPLADAEFVVNDTSFVDIIWASSDFFPGDKFGTVTASNVDFTGYVHNADYGISGANPDFPIIASGTSYSIECLAQYLGGGGQISVRAFEEYAMPYEYTYVPERAFFQSPNDAAFDPLIADGFTGGATYAMSALPTGIKDAIWWWKPSVKTSGTFSPSIDPIWALQNEFYEEYDQKMDEYDTNLPQNDLICGIRALGASNNTYYNIVDRTRETSKSIIPAVARKDPEHPVTWIGSGCTVTGINNQIFIFGIGDTGSFSLELQSRYMERLAILPYIDWSGATSKQKNWDWVKTFLPKAQGVGDSAEISNNILYAEDIWCWKSYSFLKIKFDKQQDFDMTFDLVLSYRLVEVNDPHYTCASYRADEYEINDTTYTATYPCRMIVGVDTVVVDLLCPLELNDPYLMLVEKIDFQNIHNSTGQNLIVELKELALVQDQGYDHTGRGYDNQWNINPVAVKIETTHDCYDVADYYSDFSGFNGTADGNLGNAKIVPDEPIRMRNQECIGNIQRLVHCPTFTGNATMLDYVRPIAATSYASAPGLEYNLNQSEMNRMNSDNIRGSTNSIKAINMIDLKHEVARDHEHLETGFYGRSWTIVPGYHYYITVPKIAGGAPRFLLKDIVNNRRYIKSVVLTDWEYIILQSSQYEDHNGDTIDAPSNKPKAGEYELVTNGKVSDMVNELGIFKGPNLKPSRTRMYNGDKALDINVQLDYQIKQYTLVIWADNTWTTYDLTNETQKKAFLASQLKLMQKEFKIFNRRWAEEDYDLVEPKRISATIMPQQKIVVAKPPGTKWKGETGAASGRTRIDLYRRWDKQVPEMKRNIKKIFNPQVLRLHTGNILVVGETINKATCAYIYNYDGRNILDETIPLLNGKTSPTAVINENNNCYWVVVYDKAYKGIQFYSLYRDAKDNLKWKWLKISDIAECDNICPTLLVDGSGNLMVFFNKGGELNSYISTNNGGSWETTGTTLSCNCATACFNPTTNNIYVMINNKIEYIYKKEGEVDRKEGVLTNMLFKFYRREDTFIWDYEGTEYDHELQRYYPSHISKGTAVPGSLMVANDGGMIALTLNDQDIESYVSTNNGITWEQA